MTETSKEHKGFKSISTKLTKSFKFINEFIDLSFYV